LISKRCGWQSYNWCNKRSIHHLDISMDNMQLVGVLQRVSYLLEDFVRNGLWQAALPVNHLQQVSSLFRHGERS
jgi:hypothetical protein